MGVSSVFLALLFYFWQSAASANTWITDTGALVFIAACESGFGPLSWVLATELMPSRTPVELGLTVTSSFFHAFNFIFALSIGSLVATIQVSGVFLIHAVVCALAYAFVLMGLPPPEVTDKASLTSIEHYFIAKPPSNDQEINESSI